MTETVENTFTPYQCERSFAFCTAEQRPNPVTGEMEDVKIYRETENGPVGVLEFYTKSDDESTYVNRQRLLYVTDPEEVNFKRFDEQGDLSATAILRYKSNGDIEDGAYVTKYQNKYGKVTRVEKLSLIDGRGQGPAKGTFYDDKSQIDSVLELTYADGRGQGLGYECDASGKLTRYILYHDGECLQMISRDNRLPAIYRQVKDNSADITKEKLPTAKDLYLQAAKELLAVVNEMCNAWIVPYAAAKAAQTMQNLALKD